MREGVPRVRATRGLGLGSLTLLLLGCAVLVSLLAGCSSSASPGSSARTGPSSAAPASGNQGATQGNKMTPNVPEILRAAAVQPYQGGPRLAVDEDTYDYGKVKLEDWVEPVYHIKNVGDAPLSINGLPVVRTLAGC